MMAVWMHRILPPRGHLLPSLDRPLLIAAGALVLVGILVVSSSSTEIAQAQHASPFYHLTRHLLYLSLGLFVAILTFMIPIDLWEKSGWPLLV